MIKQFGEKVDAYDHNVLNEREIRASAGILFLFAGISFANSWFFGNFHYTKIFVIAFMIDFFIRLFINTKLAPSLIIGRFFVRNKTPEYVNAKPKKWAWSLAFFLSILMFYLIILQDIKGPINLIICLTCLTLLFCESVFGICLGCKIYSLFHKDDCPDGQCDINDKSKIQQISVIQSAIAVIFIVFVIFIINIQLPSLKSLMSEQERIEQKEKDCVVPQFAIDMGHEEVWKLHNGCK